MPLLSLLSFQFSVIFLVAALVLAVLPLPKRGAWLVLASCWFFMAFIPAYILILLAVVAVDFVAGLLIEPATAQRLNLIIAVSLLLNIGFIVEFKYLDFALTNINEVFAALGIAGLAWAFAIVLPIGLSYAVDCSRSLAKALNDVAYIQNFHLQNRNTVGISDSIIQ